MKNKDVIIVLAATMVLLSIPAIGMLLGAGIDWSIFDFVIMGILLLGTGFTLTWALRKFKTRTQKLVVGGLVLLAFLLIWAELAVGIFNSPIAGS